MSTRMAPVQGLMPTENTTASAFRQEKGPASSLASTTWLQASPAS
jgi:hypothetical protein